MKKLAKKLLLLFISIQFVACEGSLEPHLYGVVDTGNAFNTPADLSAATVALYYVTGLPMTTMVGVMSGAVTNTPGLGAAQQAFSDMHAGADAPDIATGYAVAYPLGVVGAILTLIGLRYLLRIDVKREEAAAGQDSDAQKDLTTRRLSVEIVNAAVNGKTVAEIPTRS